MTEKMTELEILKATLAWAESCGIAHIYKAYLEEQIAKLETPTN